MSESELASRKKHLDNERDKLDSERSSSPESFTPSKELSKKIEEIDAENNYIASY